MRRGFAGEERPESPESRRNRRNRRRVLREREAAEITKKKGEGFLFSWIPTDTGSSVFRRYI